MEIVRPIVQECFIPAQYTSSPEIIKNCLKDVLNEGIMVTQVSAPVETEDMTKSIHIPTAEDGGRRTKKKVRWTFFPSNRPTRHLCRGDLEPWVQGSPRHTERKRGCKKSPIKEKSLRP